MTCNYCNKDHAHDEICVEMFGIHAKAVSMINSKTTTKAKDAERRAEGTSKDAVTLRADAFYLHSNAEQDVANAIAVFAADFALSEIQAERSRIADKIGQILRPAEGLWTTDQIDLFDALEDELRPKLLVP